VAATLVPVVALGISVLPAGPAVAKKKDDVRPIVSGWLPYWTTSGSIASMQANKDLLQEVSPFWYSLTWNGKQGAIATQVTSANKAAVKSAAAASGIALWPSFTDGMPARRLAWLMGKPKKRAKLIDKMVDLATTEGYAGLDLDFEKFAFSDGSSTWSSTRPKWVQFVKELGGALHAAGKQLAATTPPLCSMSGACGGTNGYWVYDWSGIGPYVDRLRIMAYDYSFSSPGPIGPYPWAEAIVRYAATQVAPGKVQLGVPTYGRDWVRRKANGSYRVSGTCPKNGSLPSNYLSRTEFSSSSIATILRGRGLTQADVKWDDTYKESYFRYKKTYSGGKNSCTVKHEGWFDDSRAVVARAQLVEKYQIAGIAAWTIGGEDPDQWGALRSLARGIAPSPTAVTASAPRVVTHGSTGKVTVVAKSQGVAVSGAPVTLQWRDSGGSAWRTLATGRTGANGTVSWARTLWRSGTFRAVVSGTWERSAGSDTVTTKVRPVLVPTQRLVEVARGGKAKLRARMLPKSGQRVVVQQRVHGSWSKLADAKRGKAGNPHLGLRVTKAKSAYRFKAKASATSARAYSSVINVRTH
jgi:spore germination protein YaaH